MNTFRLTALFIATSAAAARLCAADAITVDGYAAVVNQHVITVGNVLEVLASMEERLRASYTGRELTVKRREAWSNAVQRLVEQRLIVEEFNKSGGQIPERVVDERVNDIIRDRFDGNRSTFEKTLASQQTTLGEWRDGIRDSLIAQMLRRQEINDRIRISPADVRTAYEKQKAERFSTAEKVRVHAIVLKKGDDADAKKQQAVLLRGKIIGGESFEDMARQYSEGMKADRGGDWGWIETADWRDELKNAVAKLKVGEISPVIEAGNELFLLRLDQRQEAGTVAFDEVRPKIEEELRNAEAERLFNAWMKRLKDKNSVKIFEVSDV
jgi:peptidyl-prolyl cis-trans isomerase SurA